MPATKTSLAAGYMCSLQARALPAPSIRCWQHTTSSSSSKRYHSHTNKQRSSVAAAAVVEPAQLAAIAAEPVAEVAVLAAVGAVCAKQGLLPLQGR